MSANNLYRGLFELLTVPNSTAALAISMATTRVARRELLNVARKEDCLPELYARWDAEALLSPTESEEHEQFKGRRASAAEVLRALPAGALLAGAAGLRRGSSTLEVLLPEFAAIGALHEAMSRIGYGLDAAGEWFVQPRDPKHRGVAAYRYERASATPGAISIEVQVAGLPIDARRHLPIADLVDHATRIEGHACRALEPTRELFHRIVTFGARPTPVTVREIADLHVLLTSDPTRIDHAWLQRKIERPGAWNGLRQLRDAIVAKRLSALLPWGEFGRLIEAGAARAEADAARRPGTPHLGTLIRNAFDLCDGPRENDLVAKLARTPWFVLRVLEAGYRVRGVPVSTKAFDASRLLRIDGGLYLETGAGLMLLSLVDLHQGVRAELGERARTGSRPVVLARWSAARPRTRTR